MASKVRKKISAKLKFLYHQSKYLAPAFKRLLYNALIQQYSDYGCSSWFSLLKKKIKLKRQKAQMYLFLPIFTSAISYRSVALQENKLTSGQRVEYCIANTGFNRWIGTVPGYVHEMLKPSLSTYSTRSQMVLDIPLRKTNIRQYYPSKGQKYGSN